MLADVTDYRRSWKWGCRGRLALGFKPRHGSHTWERTTQSWRRRERTMRLWWRRGKGPHGFCGGEERGPQSFRGEEKGERIMLLLKSGDPVAATQLMVLGA